MSTGSFENWAGNISEIGAIYPFEAATPVWVILAIVFWLVWQIGMVLVDQYRLYEQVKEHDADKLRKLIE